MRGATPGDLDWLLGQLRQFASFFGSRLPIFPSEEYARGFLAAMMKEHLVLVADKDAERAGFVSGFIGTHPYNPAIRTLSEAFWWTAPEHRGSRAGLALLNEFTAYGRAHTDWVTMTLEAKSPVREECLTRRGYQPYEKSYLLEVA